MLRRSVHASFVLAVALVVTFVVAPVPAGATTVRIAAASAIATFGETVTIDGTVGGTGACARDRLVRLRWQAADADAFTPLAEATATDGAFAFEIAPAVNARYRVALVASEACANQTSNEVAVRVRAVVDASVVIGSSEVGECVDVSAIVSPAKPGQTVELQRRTGGSWSTIETLALNGDGEGRGHPCLGWDDLGVARYRVRWVAQDDLNETAVSTTLAFEVTEAAWMDRIDEIVGRRPVSVSVGDDGTYLYRHLDQADRTPASNEKLLLAMAMLDAFGPEHRISTIAATRDLAGSTIAGDLWLLGRGDPIVTRSALGRLAQALVDAGITRITGRVMGATNHFAQDWDARGWNDVARDYVNRPTALTFEGNRSTTPETAAANALTVQLERHGIPVRGRPSAGTPPDALDPLAILESKPLDILLMKMLRPSWNFAAEVLGKGLGVEARGTPGTIAKGAAAVEAWVRSAGVDDFVLYDGSGLSYANRVDAAGIVRLLWVAEAQTWGDELLRALPTGGQGTLDDRLETVQVRAKTGTLSDVSSLSGWVWAERLETWVEFSILSDVGKPAAEAIEDKIVRVLHHNVG